MSLRAVDCDPGGFKRALGAFASSVNVITMWDPDGRPVGMTATAFSSVSTDPLLVLVCLNRSSRSYARVASARRFGVNILGTAAKPISEYCARPGTDKRLRDEWLAESGDWRCPALSDALAFLDCETDQDVAAGTHAVLIGSVRAIGLNTVERRPGPLLHFRGAYRQLQHRVHYPTPGPLPITMMEDST
jgi:flavin reductase (DIM6/NTAB) family NADH-FMN oxidoreductase RutF